MCTCNSRNIQQIGQIPMHLSGDDSTGSFVSCEDCDKSGLIGIGSEECFQMLPTTLPVMCDVDAPTVVIQQTLRLPALPYASVNQVVANPIACDVDAPTVLLQETLVLPLGLQNPFSAPKNVLDDSSCDVAAAAATESPDSIKPSVSSRRRSSFHIPLDVDFKVAGISKRRSSCAFASAPLLPFSPEKSLNDSSPKQLDSNHSGLATSIIAESPLPILTHVLSPSPCRVSTSASRRKTLSSQSPARGACTDTPRRRSLTVALPLLLQSASPAPLQSPLAVDLPSVATQAGAAPAPLPTVCESACEQTAPAANCENFDPNLSKKTPEKKKRRLYNPARIPDALLEE
jgi:hypothetical protein